MLIYIMPYSIIKVKGGWRVQIDHNPTHLLAKKPFKTKREATAQMHAIMQSEHARGVEGGVFGIPFLSTIYNLIPIRKKYNTTTTKFLNQYGNMPVQSIIIYRKPIVGAVNTALNMASFGQWGRAVKKNGYDKVFHLYMIATVKQSNGQPFNILIEKNDIINVVQAKPNDLLTDNGASMQVEQPMPANLTVNIMLQKTKDSMGTNKYWEYNPWLNNCQVFIKYVLSSNGLITPQLLNFIDQNVEKIASETLSTPVQALGHAVTTLASKLRTLTGRGLNLF